MAVCVVALWSATYAASRPRRPGGERRPDAERALEEAGEIAPSADQPLDMDGLLAVSKKYQVEIVGPPLG